MQMCRPVSRGSRPRRHSPAWRSQGLDLNSILPRPEMIDPRRELPALIQMTGCGLASLAGSARAHGEDPSGVFSELPEGRKSLALIGVRTDSVPGLEYRGTVTSDA